MTQIAGIGNTPLLEVDGIYVKVECANAGGSIKDRVAVYMLERARERGELGDGDTIVETTSGNTGISLGLVARSLGHPVIIFMPEHMSEERKRMLRGLGADVRLTPKAGGFAGAIEERDAYRGRAGFYVPDQFGNPDNTRCHRETTGLEILTQLEKLGRTRVDAFVAGVGTGGTLMGVASALKEKFAALRVVAVEPFESDVMSGGAAGDHGIQGIGDGFIPDLMDMNAVDEVARVTTAEARAGAKEIFRRHGHCVGLSAGANMTAARRLRERGMAVVTVWPDCADRYLSVGLEGPSARGVKCPLRATCSERMHALLRDNEVAPPGSDPER